MLSKFPFLTADWRYLLMLNYEVPAEVLAPYLPACTTLDLWEGKALVSVIGFLFRKTRVLGIPVPFHRNFEEVNLRFYVRREMGEGQEDRRGVVFIKELVPKRMVARLANLLYGEHYQATPMRHTIEQKDGRLRPNGLVEYGWRWRGRLQRLGGLASGNPIALETGSEAAFVIEHYWGYTKRGERTTGEYRVAHPRWQIWQVDQPYLLCDVRSVYGSDFEPYLRNRPRSAFLADGSGVAVYPGGLLRAPKGARKGIFEPIFQKSRGK